MRERKIWGGLVPFDKVWRTGANASTKLTASRDFTFGETAVPKGTYSVFTIPGASSWTVILNKVADAGTADYDAKNDAARVTVSPASSGPRERMTFLFSDTTDTATRLDLEWESLRVSVPIKVDTKAQVMAGIDTALADAWRPHYQAGRYLIETGGDVDTALQYLDTSIGIKSTLVEPLVARRRSPRRGAPRTPSPPGRRPCETRQGERDLRAGLQGRRQKGGRRLEEEARPDHERHLRGLHAGGDAFFDGHSPRPQVGSGCAASRARSPRLGSVLEEQNARYAPGPARDAHLRRAALRRGGGRHRPADGAVPRSALHACTRPRRRFASRGSLAEHWGAPVVPVFWLQTEDHDAAEIAICHVARGSDEPLTAATRRRRTTAFSVAHRVAARRDRRDALASARRATCPDLPHAEEHLALLAPALPARGGMGPAFAGVLADAVRRGGLVLLDPRDPRARRARLPVHRRALTESPCRSPRRSSSERSELRSRPAGASPCTCATTRRCRSSIRDGPGGAARCRLAGGSGASSRSADGARTRSKNCSAISTTRPAAFSTSALLAPILQDTWLPTVAYVGGPAEVAYFAAAASAVRGVRRRRADRRPRAPLRLIDEATRRALARRGLTAAEVSRPIDDVLASVCVAAPDEARRRQSRGVSWPGSSACSPTFRPPFAMRASTPYRRSKRRAPASRDRRGKLGRNYDRARLLCDRELVDDVRARARPAHAGRRAPGAPSRACRRSPRATGSARSSSACSPPPSLLEPEIVDLDL